MLVLLLFVPFLSRFGDDLGDALGDDLGDADDLPDLPLLVRVPDLVLRLPDEDDGCLALLRLLSPLLRCLLPLLLALPLW